MPGNPAPVPGTAWTCTSRARTRTGASTRTGVGTATAIALSRWGRGGWIRFRWIRGRRVLSVRAPLLPPRILFLATFLAGLLIESHFNPPYRSSDDCRCSPSGCDIVNTSIQAEGFLVEQDDESQYDDQCHPVGSFVSSSDLAPIGLLWWVALGHPVSFCQTSTSCHPLRLKDTGRSPQGQHGATPFAKTCYGKGADHVAWSAARSPWWSFGASAGRMVACPVQINVESVTSSNGGSCRRRPWGSPRPLPVRVTAPRRAAGDPRR